LQIKNGSREGRASLEPLLEDEEDDEGGLVNQCSPLFLFLLIFTCSGRRFSLCLSVLLLFLLSVFLFLYSLPFSLLVFCCSSPLWKGNGAVGHGLRIQLAVHSGDRVARARKNFQTLLQWRLRECSAAVLPLLLLLWDEGAMVEESLMV
jgi:hypothetical protein